MKLKLSNIRKMYKTGESVVAINNISLGFREHELVSILGPSGCGKTTLLNMIGGIDHYDSGDLVINGLSTSKYKDSDWDAYRNQSIGFVFQNYNLIGHQSVLENVEIALTLSGISATERRKRAKQALEDVGLGNQFKKKPNQLSGGQMQRVAIARALVNNPDIILTDEPTGALDSQTSIQVMDILKDISKTRLVIMVTHNGELAEEYSDRIIRLLDGEVQSDSNPPMGCELKVGDVRGANHPTKLKTSMSFLTAAGLSLKNLFTKKGRTITTSIAGSIGIIGVSLVLALSGGLNNYLDSMETGMLSGFPVTITSGEQQMSISDKAAEFNNGGAKTSLEQFPDSTVIYRHNEEENQNNHINVFTDDYLEYIKKIETALPGSINAITYQSGVSMNLLTNVGGTTTKFNPNMGREASYWQEMPSNKDFILSLYDLIGEGSRLP